MCESSSKSIEGSSTLQIQNLSRTVLLISSVLNTVEVFAARSNYIHTVLKHAAIGKSRRGQHETPPPLTLLIFYCVASFCSRTTRGVKI